MKRLMALSPLNPSYSKTKKWERKFISAPQTSCRLIHVFFFSAGTLNPLTVFPLLPVVRHHRVCFRFIEGHPSDDHSVGAGPRHPGSCLADGGFWHRQRGVLDDLDRTLFLGARWIIASERLILFLLRRTHKVEEPKMRQIGVAPLKMMKNKLNLR